MKQEALAVVESQVIEMVAPTPMSLIQMAVKQGADIAQLEKLLDLQMRWEANEARKAFDAAMAEFKANPPTILKNKHVDHNDFWHATLDNVVEMAGGALSKVGISHRWKTGSEGGKIRVTCILTHKLGHSEETTLEAGPDGSGSKNAIQAVASTVTYLERYTLLAATGLATKGQDNDGQTSEGMKEQTVEDYLTAIKDAHGAVDCQKAFGEAWNAAKDMKDKASQERFRTLYDARKREFATASRTR